MATGYVQTFLHESDNCDIRFLSPDMVDEKNNINIASIDQYKAHEVLFGPSNIIQEDNLQKSKYNDLVLAVAQRIWDTGRP